MTNEDKPTIDSRGNLVYPKEEAHYAMGIDADGTIQRIRVASTPMGTDSFWNRYQECRESDHIVFAGTGTDTIRGTRDLWGDRPPVGPMSRAQFAQEYTAAFDTANPETTSRLVTAGITGYEECHDDCEGCEECNDDSEYDD